jgi:hypothetical protein
LCVASTSNNNIAPTAPTGTAPVSIEEKVVVANDAFIVDSVASNIEVAKFHINIEDFEKMEMMKTGKLMALIPFVEKVVRQKIIIQDILCVNKFWTTKYEILPL